MYACSVSYSNLTKKLKHRIQTTQKSVYVFVYCYIDSKSMSHEEFERSTGYS